MKTVQSIDKVAALCIQDQKLLVVYKPSIGMYITPGGKIEQGETDIQCLQREMQEELGCRIKNPIYLATFSGKNPDGSPLRLTCYLCTLIGTPTINPNDSVSEYQWLDLTANKHTLPLAPLLQSKIIPALKEALYENSC